MAKQDKETYESYARDSFDTPPVGPVGVHRGARSVGARTLPYLIVLIVAALAGALAWGVMTGEFSKFVSGAFPNSSTSVSAGGQSGSSSNDSNDSTDSSKKDSSSDSSSDGTDSSSSSSDQKSESTDGSTSSDGSSSSDGTDSSDQKSDSTDQNSTDQNTSSTDQNAQTANKATSVRVVNAAGINGYAAQKAGVLTDAGYTNVQAANPTGDNLPDSTVVWYQNETDLATAQDVATKLGIANVQQVTGIDVPVVVVLRN
ncbi:LytR C-terminal domain-containing protein [Bifidobacterium biavatii]|uniref:LytR/CpsA/Psr regulator C-terminal domain-containing protein n=1 Tax=Bifidobacterium biavatii DSM 23969 TaxID=1437608 RepID=A0A087A1V4_9BIFI|nr:LytR C-terminal domain-containing protein [Bifidobacterium biavatii]KFI52754.1 hypothetical protein BBIA_0438 [Bifidobacterium biavatii DSM 23969]